MAIVHKPSEGLLLLLALFIRYRDPAQNFRYHFALMNVAQVLPV